MSFVQVQHTSGWMGATSYVQPSQVTTLESEAGSSDMLQTQWSFFLLFRSPSRPSSRALVFSPLPLIFSPLPLVFSPSRPLLLLSCGRESVPVGQPFPVPTTHHPGRALSLWPDAR